MATAHVFSAKQFGDRGFAVHPAWLMVLAFVAALAFNPAVPAGADPGSTGSISGTVTAPDGSPAGEVAVYLWHITPGDPVAVTTTDSGGGFTFGAVEPGNYSVEYVDSSFERILHGGQTRFAALDVAVTAGETTSLAWQLRPGASISGLVNDNAGSPISGATVRARLLPHGGPGFGMPVWVSDATAPNWDSVRWSSTTTGADGRYTLPGLAYGDYAVEFSAPGFSTQYWDAQRWPTQELFVNRGRQLVGIDAVLGPSGVITGTVTDFDGAPLAGIEVVANPNFTSAGTSGAVTEADGTYRIDVLGSLTYTLDFLGQAAGYTTATDVAAGQVNAGSMVNRNQQLTELGSVAGSVVDADGDPIAGASVRLYGSAGLAPDFTTTSNADGTFALTGVRSDSYARLRIGPLWAAEPSLHLPVELTGTYNVANGTILAVGPTTLVLGATIDGRVLDDDAMPIAGATVTAGPSGSARSATTDAQGNYRITGLTPGIHEVSATSQYSTHRSASVTGIATSVSEPATGIDITLPPSIAVRGTVTDSDGAPIEGVTVLVRYQPFAWNWSGKTGADGTYVVPVALSGSATVETQDSARRFADATSSDTVNTATGAAGIDFVLERNPSLVGTINGPDGEPLAGIDIGSWWGRTESAADGSYELNGVPLGTSHVDIADQSAEHASTNLSVTVADGDLVTTRDVQLEAGHSLSGRVTGPGGTPLMGMRVDVVDEDGTTVGTAFTNSAGGYGVYSIPAGAYRVRAADRRVVPVWGEAYHGAGALVSLNDSIGGLDVALADSGTVSGRITDASGAGVADAWIVATDSLGFRSSETWTDGAGNYTLTTLGTADYTIRFDGADFGAEWYDDAIDRSGATPITVSAGAEVIEIDAVVGPEAVLSGTVIDAYGQPVPFVGIRAYEFGSDAEAEPGFTDADGNFSLSVDPGSYQLMVSEAPGSAATWFGDAVDRGDASVLTVGRTDMTDLDIEAVATASGTISGTLVDEAGQPTEAGFAMATNLTSSQVYSSFPGSDGRWSVLVPAGTYVVSAYGFETDATVFYGGTADPTPVVVADGSAIVDIDLVIPSPTATPSISGIVTNAAGEPLAGIAIQAAGLGLTSGGGVTGGDGRYQLNDLPPGEWTVKFVDPYNRYINEFYSGQLTSQQTVVPTPITVVSGELTAGIDAAMSPAGTVSGTVSGPDDAALGAVSVSATPVGGQGLAANSSTNLDGSFSINLQPGTYRLRADPSDAGLLTTWYGNVTTEAEAATFVVTGGTALQLDIGVVAGTVPGSGVAATDDAPNVPPIRRNLPLDEAASFDEVLASRDYVPERDSGTMRLYRAFFDRDPDVGGAKYWLVESRSGINYDDVAWGFANSTEFQQTYGGDLTNRQFLEIVYTNVLGRTPDAAGFEYWLSEMNNGLDKHLVVRWVAAGDEFEVRFPYVPAP